MPENEGSSIPIEKTTQEILPHFDKASGIFTDKNGTKWASVQSLARITGKSKIILNKITSNIEFVTGESGAREDSKLYRIDEILNKYEKVVGDRVQINLETGIAILHDGTRWATVSKITELANKPRTLLEKITSKMEPKIGFDLAGHLANLFNIDQALNTVESLYRDRLLCDENGEAVLPNGRKIATKKRISILSGKSRHVVSNLVSSVPLIPGYNKDGQRVDLFDLEEALKLIEKKYAGRIIVDQETGIAILPDGTRWASIKDISMIIGRSTELIERVVSELDKKEGIGRQNLMSNLYNVDEVEKKVSEKYEGRISVDPKSGIAVLPDGSKWGSRNLIARLSGRSPSLVYSVTESMFPKLGIDTSGNPANLFPITIVLDKIKELYPDHLIYVDTKTNIASLPDGTRWASRTAISQIVNKAKKTIFDITSQMESRKGISKTGKLIDLYNLDEVIREVQETYINKINVNKETGIATLADGTRWTTKLVIADLTGKTVELIDRLIISNGIEAKKGVDRGGRVVDLFNIDTVIEKIQEKYADRIIVDWKTGIATLEDGSQWTTLGNIRRLIDRSGGLTKRLSRGLISLPGIVRGQRVDLYNIKEFKERYESEFGDTIRIKKEEELFKESINSSQALDFFKLFGTANHSDILLLLDQKQYESISLNDKIKIIGKYLGEFNIEPPGLGELTKHEYIDLFKRVDELEPDIRARMAEALLDTVIKKGLVDFYGQEKQEDLEFRIKALTYLENLEHRSDSVFLRDVIDISRSFLNLIYSYSPPESIVGRLGTENERSFPDFYQKINIAEILQKRRLLIADEMGLGKSASAIFARETLKNEGKVGSTLLIVPSNIIENGTWQTYLSSERDENEKQKGYFRPGMEPKVLVVKSSNDLESDLSEYDYVIISQEKLDEGYTNKLLEVDFDMMIVDEMHKLKKVDGVRANSLLRLSERFLGDDKYCVLLSGTPVPNKVHDIAMSIKMLRPDIPEIRDASVRELARQIIAGSKDLIKLSQIRGYFMGYMQRKRLPESLVGHERTDRDVFVPMSKEEEILYKVVLEDDDLSSTEKLQSLRQLLLNPAMLQPSLETKGSRVKVLEQLIVNNFDLGKKKIVVFVNSYIEGVIRGENSLIDNMDLDEDVVIDSIHGQVSGEGRRRIQRTVNEGEDKTVIFVSGQTADVGIDLSGADSVIEYNDPWSIYDKKQQECRIYRPGLRSDIEVLTLMSTTNNPEDESTIDQGIREYILAKERAIEKLLNGVPLNDIEQRLIEKEDNIPDEGESIRTQKEVASLMNYLGSRNQILNRIYAASKGRGEQWFSDEVVNSEWGEKYAELYTLCGSRAYQPNCNRLVGTIIDSLVKERGVESSNPLILDLASGPEMLRRHAPDVYRGDNILSVDINPKHFEGELGPYHTGGYTGLPNSLRNKCDFVNFSLALHYAKFDEIPQILYEMNKVLKDGGSAIITLPYSRQLKNKEKLEEALSWLGFRLNSKYSGEAHGGESFLAETLVLEKIGSPDGSPEELIEPFQELELFEGLKMKPRDEIKLRHQDRMVEKIELNGNIIPILFNQHDAEVHTKEKQLLGHAEALKIKYGSIEAIPHSELAQSLEDLGSLKLLRVRYHGRHVLFGQVEGDSGYITIK